MDKNKKSKQLFLLICIAIMSSLVLFVLPGCVDGCANYDDVFEESVTDTIIFAININPRTDGIGGCLHELGIGGCYDGGCCDEGAYIDVGIFSCAYLSRWQCIGCLNMGCEVMDYTIFGCFACIPVGLGGCLLCPPFDE